jgi:hypothetical protein
VSVSTVVQACERLGSCLNATTSARFFELHFPEGFDIDFMVVEPDGSRRILAELNEEQEEFNEAIAAGRTKAAPKAIDKGACPTCGLKI